MSEPSKAVFLSYASQDADAARRIAEALRAARVEVWFDQSELRGGDSWDQKIRKQIKECTLFLPVVSASTQARREGYFRLEWKLAEDRTHLMAKGTPFLVPVCIDDTKDWDALVPDSFMAVQWTRLPGGETPPKFVERVAQLLTGDTTPPLPAGPRHPRPVERGETCPPLVAPEARRAVESPAGPPPRSYRWIGNVAAIGGVVMGVIFAFRAGEWSKDRPEKKTLTPAAAAVGPAVKPAAFPRDPELRRALALIDGLESTREDFRLADEISARAVERAPTDPDAVTVRARVHSAFLTRSFDFSADRTAQAKRYGERAVQLAAESPDAHYALSLFLFDRVGDFARAEAEARRACELAPDEVRFQRQLLRAINQQRPEEGLAMGEELARRYPLDPLVRYELSIIHRNRRDWVRFEQELDATLALAPIANAINWKSRAALLRGDLTEMRQWLDRVPARTRTEERTVVSRVIYATLSGDYDYGLAALRAFAEPWFFDAYYYSGPAALPQAMLLEQQGKTGLARLQYEEAMAALTRHRQENSADQTTRLAEIWILRGLGRLDEARALHRTALEDLRRPYRVSGLAVWWLDLIPRCLLLGDRATGIQLIREAADRDEGRHTIALRMKQDVRMATFRDDPEIVTLLAEPKKETVAAPLTEAAKLVASAVAVFSKLGYTREDLAVAEELARKATELEAGSATAWGARAGVQATYLFRNWDRSEKRRQDTQAFANRALGLNPEEPEALIALGHLMNQQGVDAQAEAQFRRALAADPANNRAARALATTLSFGGREEEGRAILLETVRRDPRDPLVRYDLALTYDIYTGRGRMPANLAVAFEHLDAGLAVQPAASLLLAKAVAQGGWLDDLSAMRATLGQLAKLSLTERAEDRAVYIAMWGGLLERNADRVLAAATLTAKNYLEDTVVPRRPLPWSLALAHRLQGKENLARLDWQRAEQLARTRLHDQPGNQFTAIELAIALAWLGRTDEATREVAPIEAAWREELIPARARMLALYYAALGEAAKAAPYLRVGLNTHVFLTTKTLPRDPWFDKLRGQPEFEALLQEPAATK